MKLLSFFVRLFYISTLLTYISLISPVYAQIPAFPGAEGFGSTTPGGRGGTIIEVTNLNEDGPGSFRDACEASGARIIVFRTGGTIQISKRIKIKNPFITIAGQSAPGGGICIRGATLVIETHDVIIRGLRIRVGDDPEGPSPGNRDGILIANRDQPTYNVIVDHCSISWGIDENADSWYEYRDVTIQWCIISEGLNKSIHPKGDHSKGLLLGGNTTGISIHHNILAHNVERSPRLTGGLVDFVNNIIYNSERTPGYFRDDFNALSVNYVGNYVKGGPNSSYDYAIRLKQKGKGLSVFVKGNIGPHRSNDNVDDRELVKPSERRYLTRSQHKVANVTTLSAFEAYKLVLSNAGATHPQRDAADERIIKDIQNGSGHIIDSQNEVGGWPELDRGKSPPDTDHDGIPDEWENTHGLDPHNSEDGNEDRNGDGYINIEEYLNSLFLSIHLLSTQPENPRVTK